jgi:secretion/DNA translocation related TadE-like protein
VTRSQASADRLGERGGASLVALALAAFLLLAGLLAVDVGALAAARAAAQNAADMAALAALTPGGGSPPAKAGAIASANGAELAGCDCSAVQAVVAVRRRVVLAPAGLPVWVTARARAVLASRPAASGGARDRERARRTAARPSAAGGALARSGAGRARPPDAAPGQRVGVAATHVGVPAGPRTTRLPAPS